MTALDGPLLDRVLFIALGVAIAVTVFALARRSPKAAFAAAIAIICFVPIWIGIGIGFNGNLFVPLAAVAALVTGAAMLPISRFRWSPVDGMLAFLLIVAASSLVTGNASIALSFLITPFTYWVSGYVLGRVGGSRIRMTWLYGAIAVMLSAVAVATIIEFLTAWNPFVQLGIRNSLFAEWGGLQERGGVLRAEGAFGHSIALSSSLALAIPLALASRFRFPIRLGMVALLLVATVFTFSRIGIISALIGLVLSIVFLPNALTVRMRVILAAATGAVTVALFPVVETVFAEAGAEAAGSAEYRIGLLSLLEDMNLVGVSDLVRRSPSGELFFDTFQSIDSQLILTGLTNGIVAVAAIVLILIVAVLLVLRGRATAATIAIVAQIPAFAAVALITQYSILLWVVAGLAATSQLLERDTPPARLPLGLARARPEYANRG